MNFLKNIADILRKKELPAFWKAYEQSFRQNRANDANPVRYVAFDTETTGLNPASATLLSIGAVAIIDGTIWLEDSFEMFVEENNQKNGRKSIPIHGIVPGKYADGTLEEVLPTFISFLNNAVLIGHHVEFDIAMIQESLKKMGVSAKLKNKRIDTAAMAIRLDYAQRPLHLEKGKYTLDALSDRFSIPLHDRHNAAGDAYITAQIFLKILPLLRERGIRRLERL